VVLLGEQAHRDALPSGPGGLEESAHIPGRQGGVRLDRVPSTDRSYG
jgi:hypothetical protein